MFRRVLVFYNHNISMIDYITQPASPFQVKLDKYFTQKKETIRLERQKQEKAIPWSGKLGSYKISLIFRSLGSCPEAKLLWLRGLGAEFLMCLLLPFSRWTQVEKQNKTNLDIWVIRFSFLNPKEKNKTRKR